MSLLRARLHIDSDARADGTGRFAPSRATGFSRVHMALATLAVAALSMAGSAYAQGDIPQLDTAESEGPGYDESRKQGTLRVLVFLGEAPVAGARVEAGGVKAETNADGATEIRVLAGMVDLIVTFEATDEAGQKVPVSAVQQIGVLARQTSEVIVSLESPGAEALWDVEGPSQAQIEGAAAVQEATEFGTIVGYVKSIEDSVPVVDARVYVRGVDAEAITDQDGRFEIEVPVGSHAISLIHPQFSTLSRPDVEVVKDAATEIDVVMTPASVRLDDFIVTAPHIEGSVAGLMEERRESASVSDAIGREDIAKMPANDAAGAAQRVVGATIVGGRFVYVRGLGERYTNALLNGGPLPSPEPDRATVPLDLFPSQILESLDIAKTFTPDVPGDFAGGSVRIITRGVPEGLIYNVGLSTSFNSQSTFRYGWQDPQTPTDWLGYDNGRRALSSEVPSDYSLSRGADKPDGTRLTTDEIDEIQPSINSRMTPRKMLFGPDVSGSALVGKGWEFKKGRKFGVLSSLMYRYSYDKIVGIRRQYITLGDPEPVLWNDYKIKEFGRSVRIGAFGTAVAEFGEAHKLQMHLMHSQLADNDTRLGEGYQDNEAREYRTTRLEYSSRGLTTGQVQGEHSFDELNDAKIDWRVWLSRAARDQPDTRDTAWGRGTSEVGGDWTATPSADSGRHFFSAQTEIARGGALDWTQPLWGGDFATKLKTGTMINAKKREFRSRRLTFRPGRGSGDADNCGTTYDIIACSDTLFVADNIGYDNLISISDGFRKGDAYDAVLNVYAGYGMMDFQLGEHWRALGGARVERTVQILDAIDPFQGDAKVEDASANLETTNVLPAGSVVYSPIDDFSIRTALTKTLARPQLRELAPFIFADYFGGAVRQGNPDLVLTTIINADLRFEWFPTAREVLALSLFYKNFTAPIEPVILASGSAPVSTYQNADSAQLYGLELEVRKSLDFASEKLEDLTLIGSLMLAQSQIELADSDVFNNTSANRPLVNQAPWVINLALDYDNDSGTQCRLLYNVMGPQISEVGNNGLPDAYLQPRHVLDATFSQSFGDHWKMKINAKNLTNAKYLVTLGRSRDGLTRVDFREGASASIGASYSY